MSREGEVEAEVAGQSLLLSPSGAVYWPSRETLLIADVHFGKAASFRAAAIPIPGGTTKYTLRRLDELIFAYRPQRLVFLGDLWHAKEGRTPEVVGQVRDWRERHRELDIRLVEGNHDRRSGRLPPELLIEEVAEPHLAPPFALRHYPEPEEGGYVLAGHIHPAACLQGLKGPSMRLRCFWFSDAVGVLPAFGEFTGSAEIEPLSRDRVFVIADERVMEIPAALAGCRT